MIKVGKSIAFLIGVGFIVAQVSNQISKFLYPPPFMFMWNCPSFFMRPKCTVTAGLSLGLSAVGGRRLFVLVDNAPFSSH